jgi:RND superfamily putative drug exporter
VILAGTFASMMLAGNNVLSQMGFAISVGIAIAAFVMAMFFTPAVTALIGHRAWWPGHGDQDSSGTGRGSRRDQHSDHYASPPEGDQQTPVGSRSTWS